MGVEEAQTGVCHCPSSSPACIMAFGRATPPFQINQSMYPQLYFNLTKASHNTELMDKFARICQRSEIETRHSIITEEFLEAHPEFCAMGEPTMEARNKVLAQEVLKLAHGAAERAMEEWGRPAADITHLIVATLTCLSIPGTDSALAKSLGLRQDVNRIMLYMVGCHAGLTALRIAKDIAGSDPAARILICCGELGAATFRPPQDACPHDLVGMALMGDGACSMVVGARPILEVEKWLYEIHWAGQRLVPGTERVIEGVLTSEGLRYYLDRALPGLVGEGVACFARKVLSNAPVKLGFNDAFWAVHPGGPAILNAVERAVDLKAEKLLPSRKILASYGNSSASTVLFVLDELRRRQSQEEDDAETDWCEWGIALAFGPGLTMDGLLLKRHV